MSTAQKVSEWRTPTDQETGPSFAGAGEVGRVVIFVDERGASGYASPTGKRVCVVPAPFGSSPLQRSHHLLRLHWGLVERLRSARAADAPWTVKQCREDWRHEEYLRSHLTHLLPKSVLSGHSKDVDLVSEAQTSVVRNAKTLR